MNNRPVGILCLHGFLGHPGEFAPLEKRMKERGYPIKSIALHGHGDNPRFSLLHAQGNALVDEAREGYQDFMQECASRGVHQIILLGHSLGGLLSLILAAEKPQNLAGVISLSAPYEHAFTFNRQHGWVTELGVYRLVRGLRFLKQSFTGLQSPLNRHVKPWQLPRVMQQAKGLFKQLQQGLPEVSVPVWLAHSPFDLTVPYVEMEKIARILGSRAKMKTLTQCGHQIFPRSREVDTVIDWVEQIAHTLEVPAETLRR